MSDIYQVLDITAPIFALIVIGYLAVKFSIVPRNSSQVISGFLVNFALPALLFQSISTRPVLEIFNATYLLAYGAGSLLAFVLLFAICVKQTGKGFAPGAIFAMGGSFSNSLMIGLPVITRIFGDAAMVPLALTLLVETLVILPLTLILADSATRGDGSMTGILAGATRRVFSNPIVASILLGVGFSFVGAELPGAVIGVIDLLAATVSGVALFAIGGMLVGANTGTAMRDASLIIPVKLIVHPLMVLMLFSFLPAVDPLFRAVGIILACMPMVGIYPVIAQRYGLGQTCAAVLVPATILSFATLNIGIWLLGS